MDLNYLHGISDWDERNDFQAWLIKNSTDVIN